MAQKRAYTGQARHSKVRRQLKQVCVRQVDRHETKTEGTNTTNRCRGKVGEPIHIRREYGR